MSELAISRNRTPGGVSFRVVGPEPQVRDWLRQLKANYHPAGYGTYGGIRERRADGTVVMTAWRANSCD